MTEAAFRALTPRAMTAFGKAGGRIKG